MKCYILLKTALFGLKNDRASLTISELFAHFLIQLFVLGITVLAYVSLVILLAYAELQHTIAILIVLTIQLLHRWAANELYVMAAWSCTVSKFIVAFIIAMLVMPYTAENPTVTGENTFHLFQAIVFIKSTLRMGVMYILLGLCTFDALLGFILYCSENESEVRMASLIMQTIILLVFGTLLEVEIAITLL
jgi:hypothetical protein